MKNSSNQLLSFPKTLHWHGLRELSIESIEPPKNNGFHQGALLAQYIDAIFPGRKRLEAYGDLDKNQNIYWAGIEEAVKWCQECKRFTSRSILSLPLYPPSSRPPHLHTMHYEAWLYW